MRSPAGLRRTAEMFDVWNPASGSIEQIMATAAEIDAHATVRTCRRSEVVQRIFTEPPFVVRGPGTHDGRPDGGSGSLPPATPAWPTSSSTRDSRPRSTDPDEWATFPDRLAPLLDAAAGDQPG